MYFVRNLGHLGRHEGRNTGGVLNAAVAPLPDLADVLRMLVRDHAKDFLHQARFRDGGEYHRELIRAAPEFLAASRALHAVLRSAKPDRGGWGPRRLCGPGGGQSPPWDRSPRPRGLPEHFELWLLSWLPGQVTPIHDHGGVATVTTVLSGAVLEERFAHVDGTRVRPTWGARREVGDIDALDTGVIHRVRPIGNAVTLHLYVPACVDGQIFEEVGPSAAALPERP
jgi:hypothetical protein